MGAAPLIACGQWVGKGFREAKPVLAKQPSSFIKLIVYKHSGNQGCAVTVTVGH